jgi:hypothetical protein
MTVVIVKIEVIVMTVVLVKLVVTDESGVAKLVVTDESGEDSGGSEDSGE